MPELAENELVYELERALGQLRRLRELLEKRGIVPTDPRPALRVVTDKKGGDR
jgi:hypothetical protein